MRKSASLAFLAAAVAIVAIGGGLWFLHEKEVQPGCDQLMKDARIAQSLGKNPGNDMTCEVLGRSLKEVATGNGDGHSLSNAQSMRLMIGAVSDSMPLDVGSRLTINPALRQPIADALADYSADTQEIMAGVDVDYRKHDGPSGRPWKDANGVHMSVTPKVLARVMRAVSDSPEAYSTLWKASMSLISLQMDRVAQSQGVAGVRPIAVAGARVMGTLQAVRFDAIRDRHDGDDSSVAAQEIADVVSDPMNNMSYHVGDWAKDKGIDEGGRDVDVLQRDVRNYQNAALQDTEGLLGVRRG